MKKNVLTIAALMAFAGMQAQIQINNGSNAVAITNSNVMIDGSTAFSTEAGAGPNVGKGIIIPSVDLVNFQFDLSLADGVTFPTYFDGMIVYNNATGNTLTTGNRPSASLAVTPGYYYFSNPSGASNGNVTGGQWKALGGTASGGDNLGNHSATKDLAMNSFAVHLKDAGDTNNELVYNATVDGPRLFGGGGGYLGTSNGTNALNWDSNGNLLGSGNISAGTNKSFHVVGTSGIVWDTHGGGWYMDEGTTMKVANNKHITTGGNLSIGGTITGGSEVFAGINGNYHVRGDAAIVWDTYGGGWFMSDNSYMRVAGDKSIRTGGSLSIGGDGGISGALGVTGAITGASDIYAGTNKSFHVVGTSGIVWDTHGGGWYMDESTTMKVANNKSITTGGNLSIGGTITGGSEVYAGTNGNYHVRGNAGIVWDAYGGGWFMSDNSYMRVAGDKSIRTGGSLSIGGDGGISGALGVTGAITGASDIYAGTNKSFHVVGTSGIVWDTHGGGWYMDESTTMKVANNKNIYTGGSIQAGGTVITPRVQGPSDRRFKKDITPIYNATEKLNQLNGYTYTWRDKKEFPGQTLGEGKDMGVIAQEVEKVFPDAVMTNKEGYKSVNYNALIPVLIEALKESNKKIQALEDRLNGSPAESTARMQKREDGIPAVSSPLKRN